MDKQHYLKTLAEYIKDNEFSEQDLLQVSGNLQRQSSPEINVQADWNDDNNWSEK